MLAKKRDRKGSKKMGASLQLSDAAHIAGDIKAIEDDAADGPAVCTVVQRENNVESHDAVGKQKPSCALERLFLRSLVIAPDVVGIRCVAIHPNEREMVFVRENGSMVLYGIDSFQNVPHFEQIRHTGGRASRTITRVRYLQCERSFILASYLSGQFVLYCGETLAPLHVHQRTGGAIWDFCVTGSYIYTAMADGSWHQLRVDHNSTVPTITLQRIVPKVSGADRALSVCCSKQLAIVAGTDDAGNVVVWRLPREEEDGDGDHGKKSINKNKNNKNNNNSNNNGSSGNALSVTRNTSLSGHEGLWTSRLPKGIALCCCISCGANGCAPVVAVGTSMGDVVLFDALHGHVLKTFTHHKGPVSTIMSGNGVFYASGWHESLRSYCCGSDNEWFPAEVKRRTHYHEASELLFSKRHQLLFSAARDGTVMYAPLDSVFTSPAMYIPVTTQQFAFAKSKNVLLQTRRGRIEGFCPDAAMRHWVPLFAHKIHGKFYLQGLWCDERLHYILFSTDERVALLKLRWREGKEDALALYCIEEVASLTLGRGVLDCCFVQHNTNACDAASTDSCYLLLEDAVLHITLGEGYPVVSTEIHAAGGEAIDGGIRPTRLLLGGEEGSGAITVCGLRGRLTCRTAPDGTMDPSSFVWSRESTRLAAAVPMLQQNTTCKTFVALTNNTRYVAGFETSAPCLLPQTLPHDVRFIAQLPPEDDDDVGTTHKSFRFLAYFARGLLCVSKTSWRMLHRCTVEAAFVMKGDERVLVLVRNIEGTLEALPLCWKVRRFGN